MTFPLLDRLAEAASKGPQASTEADFDCDDQAVFVHVPAFGVFDSTTQLTFVHSLLTNITEHLTGQL